MVELKNVKVMITNVEMFGVRCDNCKEDYHDTYNGFVAMTDESSMVDSACCDNWTQEGEKHYCPDCHYYDDDDNLIIDESRTKNN